MTARSNLTFYGSEEQAAIKQERSDTSQAACLTSPTIGDAAVNASQEFQLPTSGSANKYTQEVADGGVTQSTEVGGCRTQPPLPMAQDEHVFDFPKNAEVGGVHTHHDGEAHQSSSDASTLTPLPDLAERYVDHFDFGALGNATGAVEGSGQDPVIGGERGIRMLGVKDPSDDAKRTRCHNSQEAQQDMERTQVTGRADASEVGVDGLPSPLQSNQKPEPQSPLLADEVLKAVATAARKQRKKGDVAVILDPHDLTKALLIFSNRLRLASNIIPVDSVGGKGLTSGLSHILVLEHAGSMPLLQSLDLGPALADLQAHFIGTKASSVKIEVEGEDEVPSPRSAKSAATSAENANWAAAYRTTLEVVEASALRAAKRQVFESNAAAAHSRICAVIAIAKHYDILAALEMTFIQSMNAWIANRTLYSAIKGDPVSWLDIGITMRNRDIFDVASVHCVGGLVSFPNGLAQLHPDVAVVMQNKAAKLQERRKKVDPKLMTLILTTMVREAPGYRARAFVSPRDDAVAWTTNQLFANWMHAHLCYLNADDEDEGERAGSHDTFNANEVNIKTTATCDHKGGRCLNPGGFYRLIGKADDSYLPLQKVIKLLVDWDAAYFKTEEVEERVRAALQELKRKAAGIVGGLAESKLVFPNVEEMEYLTCVDVGDGDVPWGVDEEEGEEDVGMEE